MIIVKGRELLIPNNERYIGTIYDTESENRQIQVNRYTQGGVDLSALTFRLDLEYPDETKDTLILDKEVTDDYILLTWEITTSQMQNPGTLFIQIRAADENITVKWSTFKAAMYVENHIYTPGSYTGDLTEIEQLEAHFAAFANAESIRQSNEATRIVNEDARIAAETARAAAEAERETAFTDAIDDFNRDRQDLEDMRDDAVDAATQAAIYKDLCETYADVIVPVLYVDFTDGILKYNDNSSFEFTVNRTNGQLEYELTQGA